MDDERANTLAHRHADAIIDIDDDSDADLTFSAAANDGSRFGCDRGNQCVC
jgi:hypothetical protein